jgi:short subunit dehydrogenase-like uncharacterized protein
MSAGTAKTMIEGLPRGGRVRRAGRLETVPLGSLMTLRAESVEFNVSPTPGGNLLTIGSPGGTVMFDEGISRSGSVLDMAETLEVTKKSGAEEKK